MFIHRGVWPDMPDMCHWRFWAAILQHEHWKAKSTLRLLLWLLQNRKIFFHRAVQFWGCVPTLCLTNVMGGGGGHTDTQRQAPAHMHARTHTHKHTCTQTHRPRKAHADAQKHRHTDTKPHRNTDRRADRHTQTPRHTDTQAHRDTEIQKPLSQMATKMHPMPSTLICRPSHGEYVKIGTDCGL